MLCMKCGASSPLPTTTPRFGTSLVCAQCHAPFFTKGERDAGSPAESVKLFFGYDDCSLAHPTCPSCRKINYDVVFPGNGYALAWYHNKEPQNPEGFFIDIQCVHCGGNFVVEWDEFPLKARVCNYCSTIGIGIDFFSLPESRRRDFELHYGRPPKLPSPIKKGNGEPLWLICPPCMETALQRRKS